VHLTFFRAGRVYLHSQEIKVPWTNKELSFEYASFRDKLLPGGTEEWRLKVKDHSGGAVLAEVLASMYDASLDAFRKSDWNSSVYSSTGRSHNWLREGFNSSYSLQSMFNFHDRDYPIRSFERLDWQNYYISNYRYESRLSQNRDAYSFIPFDDELKSSGVVVAAENESAGSSRPVVMDKLSESGVSDISDIVSLQSGAGSGAAAELESVHARANFAETAFFYPNLRTDADGGVYFSFQVPESLTRWKFRALASTTALQLGYTEREAVTQKPLMVQPNLPRFLREGDRITLSAKISSLDDADHSGYCQLFLFDALSMQPVDSLFALAQARQPFSVAKGASAALTWELNMPFGLGAVTCRFVAASGDFSDGEENTLPILSNRMLVTESLPLAVRGRSEKAFDFTRLREHGSDTLRHYKLTLEYSSNPAWYAIQALPYLMEDPYPCNEGIFARFYANSLAAHIAQSDPHIERVFKAWRDSPSSTALLSKLEQNEELKSLLLQETPWVMDAQNETEAKHRLGLLFDLNHMAGQSNSALAILARNQLTGGGWSWFNGMEPSWWTTQYIVEGFGHLDHLGVGSARSAEVQGICDAALGYLDGKIRDSYLYLKKKGFLNLDNLGYLELHYLYTRSFFLHKPVAEDAREAVDYFLGQARKHWRQWDFYSMGLIALSLHRRGDREIPPRILASLREHSLHDEELGTWWRGAEGWFWYQAPIGRQALLIEAFRDRLRHRAGGRHAHLAAQDETDHPLEDHRRHRPGLLRAASAGNRVAGGQRTGSDNSGRREPGTRLQRIGRGWHRLFQDLLDCFRDRAAHGANLRLQPQSGALLGRSPLAVLGRPGQDHRSRHSPQPKQKALPRNRQRPRQGAGTDWRRSKAESGRQAGGAHRTAQRPGYGICASERYARRGIRAHQRAFPLQMAGWPGLLRSHRRRRHQLLHRLSAQGHLRLRISPAREPGGGVFQWHRFHPMHVRTGVQLPF